MKKNFNVKTNIFLMTIGLSLAVFNGCVKETDQNATALNPSEVASDRGMYGQHPFVAGEFLVKFKEGTTAEAQKNSLSRVGGSVVETILTSAMRKDGIRQGVLLVHTSLNALDAINQMSGLREVEYAEPNFIYRHFDASNDTYYTNSSLWGMYSESTSPSNQYGSQAGEAWNAGHQGSSDVWVGIIDEGYMYNHTDLTANAGKNPGEIASDGLDNDSNGYIDDVYGWDFDGNNNSVFDGVDDDHGTHVAGTIGAKGGNNAGVAGMCWNVKLMNAKFLGKNGGTTANAIKAVDYFNGLDDKGTEIVATNNSWGGGGFSQGLADAIERANTRNILFVAAAGNDGVNIDPPNASYPASYTNANIIAVASITSTGGLSSFSNYGATSVDLGAPGSGIWSTVPKRQGSQIVSSYASYSGTSMATPHVTGAAALYKASNPGADAATIKAAILNTTISTNSLNGKCITGGRLNVGGF